MAISAEILNSYKPIDVEKIDAPSYRGVSVGKAGSNISFTIPLEAFFEKMQQTM